MISADKPFVLMFRYNTKSYPHICQMIYYFFVTLATSPNISTATFAFPPAIIASSFDLSACSPNRLELWSICTVNQILNTSGETLSRPGRASRVHTESNSECQPHTCCQIWSEPGYLWERQLGREGQSIMHYSPVFPNKPRSTNICSCFQTGQKCQSVFCLWTFKAF